MNISYARWSHPETSLLFDRRVKELASGPSVRRVCDVGGGANPQLPLDFVQKHGLEYTVVDISAEELAKAPDGYRKVVGDIASPDLPVPPGSFDLVFSRMVAEHVPSGEAFHRRIFEMLAPGGTAFHFFPTLFTLPFTLNRLLPERFSESILLVVTPHRVKSGKRGKFPAYYSWCYGPTSRQLRRFESLGYRVDEYVGFFGHDSYYEKIKPLLWLHAGKCRWLLKQPIPLLTSCAFVKLQKCS